jgi:hypothetical protein
MLKPLPIGLVTENLKKAMFFHISPNYKIGMHPQVSTPKRWYKNSKNESQ